MKPTLLAMAAILLFSACHSHDPPDHIAPERIKQLMKYHGTHMLYELHDGQFYFKRNGQRIYVRINNGEKA